jgi:hypothetical protein
MSRRALLAAVVLAACGAPPPPAPPAPPLAATPALRFEATHVGDRHQLHALDAAGREILARPLVAADAWTQVGDTHAFALVPEEKRTRLLRLGAGEHEIASTPLARPTLTRVGERVLVFARGDAGLLWVLVADLAGKVLLDATVTHASPGRAPVLDPAGRAAAVPLADGGALRFPLGEPEPVRIPASATSLPSADRALRVTTGPLAFLPDGALLTGAADGTVAAFEPSGARRFALGFPGPIRGFAPTPDGGFAVTTREGFVARVAADGKLRWQRRPSPDALGAPVITGERVLAAAAAGVFAFTLDGDLAFSHASQAGASEDDLPLSVEGDVLHAGPRSSFRLADPHPPIPATAPSFEVRFERLLDRSVDDLLVLARDDVWALRAATPDSPIAAVHHFDGRRFTPVPLRVPRGLLPMRLVHGPEGGPLILAMAVDPRLSTDWNTAGPLRLLGWDGHAWKQVPGMPEIVVDQGMPHFLGSPARHLCFGAQEPRCLTHDGQAYRVSPSPTTMGTGGFAFSLGAVTWMSGYVSGHVHRGEGSAFTEVSALAETGAQCMGGSAPDDLWIGSSTPRGLHRFDGATARWEPAPLGAVRRVFVPERGRAFAADEALHRFEGGRWARLETLRGRVEALAGRGGREPVWVGTGSGVFRSAAWVAGPPVTRLPEARALDEGALPAPAPLPLGPADDTRRVERVTLPITPGSPLRSARGVSSARGVTWIVDDERLVEVDEAGRGGREIARAERFGKGFRDCQRCAFPEARGKGRVILRDALFQHDGARRTRVDPSLDGHIAVGGAAGRFLALGAAAHDDLFPQALSDGPVGARWLTGLPVGVWSDVAVTEDGSAFLAGGASATDAMPVLPAGEGRLVHLRGGAVTWARAAGSLIAVAAVGPEEAWAVGAGGAVLHLHQGRAERFTLPSGQWLRAVFAAPGELWMAGDGGTLLRHDGRAFRPVSTAALGPDASLTGLGGSGDVLWAVSPSGLLRITRR